MAGSPVPDVQALHEHRQVIRRAASLLAAAADFGDTLRQTLASCLPALGDFGFFDATVGPDEVRRTAAAHEDPRLEEVLAPTQWVKQEHPELNLCALSTGEEALHPDIDDRWYRRIAANEQHLAVLQALAFRSMLTVPMRYRGELVGALTLFMGKSGRRHTVNHLELAKELAFLAAPLVVNARLLAQHERSEAALRESGEKLRMAVDASKVGIWDWNIVTNEVTWSERVYALHQMPLGSDTGGLEGFRSRVHPQDLERVEGALRAALAGGPAYEVEFRTVRPDGSIRWIATRSELVRGADGKPLRMIGANLDTTDRMELLAAERRARAEAEAARSRLERLARAGEMLAQSLDPEATLATIASNIVPDIADWCRIDLLDEQGALQRRLAHHTDPERAAKALAMAKVARAAATTVGSMAWCITHSQAHYGRYIEPPASEDPVLREYTQTFGMQAHYIVPLIARGRTIGAMAVIQAESGRDLSEPNRDLVRELGHRAALALDNARVHAEVQAARQQAESASRTKDEFLAVLGHELRNPLAPITTALELMNRREATAHVEERRIIQRQVTHLSRLIDDLLDVSRITQGKIDLQRAPLDLRKVVEHALEQTQPVYERRSQPVDVELPPSPVRVDGDFTRLTQVVCNLLINAAKFTPPAGRVRLTLCVTGEEAELTVRDSGQGIDAELLPLVFEPFVQGQQTLHRESGGLGLGLAIVRMLVVMHGGQVQARSDGRECGSRFDVRLPVLREQAGGTGPQPVQAVAAAGPRGNARLLIVDDNTDAADMLADLLRMLDYEVRCAGDGAAATELLRHYRPDLCFLDIGLPGEDGYSLARRLRADAATAATKLVALTGYGSERDRALALAAGFDEHLVKPVSAERLMATLKGLLG